MPLGADLNCIQHFVLTDRLGPLYCGGCRFVGLVTVVALVVANRYLKTVWVTPKLVD
jgi:hypothetical protein